ncbi:hypothetical protein WBK31_21280 [Nonomuraea sp. N2-4H]|uniref:hypothetical protein n=1 Tax=Nonomuraea sp. N2-4H TaxID=3128898 RepID=UPI00325394AF
MRAALLTLVTAFAFTGTLHYPLLLAAVPLAGVSEVFAGLSARSILPMTVSGRDLTRANGRVSTAMMIGNEFVGAPLGGLLVALVPAVLFGAPALLYAAAAGLLLLGMRGTFAPAAPARVRPMRADIKRRWRSCGRTGCCAAWRSRPGRSTSPTPPTSASSCSGRSARSRRSDWSPPSTA